MNLAERTSATGLHDHVASKILGISPNKKSRILDLGCGTGALLVKLSNLGYSNLTGADIKPPTSIHNIEFIESDLDNFRMDLPDSTVDIITAVEVLEHLDNVGSLLDEVNRLLKVKGTFVITTPNLHSIEARLRFLLTNNLKQFDAKGDPTHISPIFKHSFQTLAERHGFTILEHWGYPEDGGSPTSALPLRLLSKGARLLGLRGQPNGDQLCLLLERSEADNFGRINKSRLLTEHYQ